MLEFPAIFRCSTLNKLAPAQIEVLLSLSLLLPLASFFVLFLYLLLIFVLCIICIMCVCGVWGYVCANSEGSDPCEAGIMGGSEAT